MLNAIVLEITIKVIWELDNNRDCKHTHNISKLYKGLKENSRRELEKVYDEQSTLISSLEGTDKKGQRMRIGDLVQLQTLRDALVAKVTSRQVV